MSPLAANPLLLLVGGALLGGGAYLVTMVLLRSDEIGLVVQLAKRR
jgi:hypothetical protein